MAFFAGASFFLDTDVALFTVAEPFFPVSAGEPEALFFPAAAALVLVVTEENIFLSTAAAEVATFSFGAGAPSESEEYTRMICLGAAAAPTSVFTLAN